LISLLSSLFLFLSSILSLHSSLHTLGAHQADISTHSPTYCYKHPLGPLATPVHAQWLTRWLRSFALQPRLVARRVPYPSQPPRSRKLSLCSHWQQDRHGG
jgi:hypothetical protein